MNRNPETGDVVKINKKEMIVVKSYERVDEAHDGPYYAYVFETIPYAVGTITAPKITERSLKTGSIYVGKRIALEDIDLISRVEVMASRTEVVTTPKKYGAKPKTATSTVFVVKE